MKINNLKFGTKKINSKFKLIKKKLKFKLTAASLAIIVSFSGCNALSNNKQTTNNQVMQDAVTSDTSYTSYNYSTNYEYNSAIDYSNIYNYVVQNFDEDEAFDTYINSYDIGYDFVDYYNIDALLEKNGSSLDISYNSEVEAITTAEQLYNVVLENNNKFMKSSIHKNFYDEFSKNKLKNICSLVMDIVNKYINAENKGEVYTVLNNLKILSKNIINNGYLDDNDTLVISENKSFNGEKFENIVTHEAVHLLQKNSIQNIEDGSKRVGVCISWEDEEINSLDWSWFYEASAAQCMEDTLNTTSGSYQSDLNYLNIIKLATILNSPSATTLEEICNNKDINNLFDYFNCKTVEEKKELIAMMYSIEIINNRPDEIMSVISDSDNLKKLKSDIYVNLTKYFYKNMAAVLKNNNMSIDEIFSLINLFESNLNYDLITNYYKKFETNKAFMASYAEIQNQFFHQLETVLGLNYDTIYDAYIGYVMNNNQSDSLNINSLSDETNSWLSERKNKYFSESKSIIQEDYYNFLEFVNTK